MTDSTTTPLRILCFGVGAIGTYIGGSLALAGNNVVFVERPEVAAEARKNGLSVTVGGVTRRIDSPQVVENINTALLYGPFDAAILAVKSFDTQSVIEGAGPEYLASFPPVISFQNGVETVVLQAGEDPGLDMETVSETIRAIRKRTPLAITLSLGERDDRELATWRQDGADRYLLRFETSNRALYDRIHPARGLETSDRISLLGRLRALGYETGGGVMIGLPGQTREDLADDVEMFARLDLDMIGLGPYLPHPATPLAAEARPDWDSELMTYRMVALARLACPGANIPGTTALATVNRADGRELALARGANVLMPNLTPTRYREHYEIYPDKACLRETATVCDGCLRGRLQAIGRTVGEGRGDARREARNEP